MQHERRRLQAAKGRLDGVEMLRALGQDQHLTVLGRGVAHLGADGLGPGRIVGDLSEDVLDAGIRRLIDPGMARTRHHLQVVRCPGRGSRRVADRPALHEDDRLLPVASDRGRRQAEHVLRLGPLEDRVEGDGADVLAHSSTITGP